MSVTPLYGIADLHLPDGGDWGCSPHHHCAEQLLAQWHQQIPDEAVVLVAGDVCLDQDTETMRTAYEQLDALPGQAKLIVPGNHDWPHAASLRGLRRLTSGSSLQALLGSAARIETAAGALVVAGTCGAWPTMNGGGRHRPCYQQEVGRLRRALAQAESLRQGGEPLIVLTHYPPRPDGRPTSMSRMIESARADLCVYGHVHDPRRWPRLDGRRYGRTVYRLLAADFLRLEPRRLGHLGRRGLLLG